MAVVETSADHVAPAASDHGAAPYRASSEGGDAGEREMRDLEELLSKLNPMAEEFVPPSLAAHPMPPSPYVGYYPNGPPAAGFAPVASPGHRGVVGFPAADGRGRKKFGGYGGGYPHGGKRRVNSRTSQAQRDEVIRRTVYVSDIDHQVTEEQLAALFINVVDCRMCGDPNSVLRFAFIEFTDEEGARAALNLSGTVLGYYPVRVLPSKTAIAPVNPTFLPRSDDEREMCARTIYCTNIDKKVC
ncbi:hypothetical protein ACQJBY_064930 [Aegilops geniculata]